MLFIQKHPQNRNKTAFKNKSDTLSTIPLYLGFLLFAVSFLKCCYLTVRVRRVTSASLTLHDAHVEQHKAQITEKRKIKGGNYRISFLIQSPYLKYCFGLF